MKSKKNIRIAIAEDHQLLRNTLESVLNQEDDFDVVHTAGNGTELLSGIKNQSIDIVILDLNMPIMDGRETLPVLKKDFPDIKILILSMYDGNEYIEKYMRLGAHGYLSKDCAPLILSSALRQLFEDGIFLLDDTPRAMLQRLIDENILIPPVQREVFSDDEISLIHMIYKEKSIQDIAAAMATTVESVEAMLAKIRNNLNVRSTIGIKLFAMKNNLFYDIK